MVLSEEGFWGERHREKSEGKQWQMPGGLNKAVSLAVAFIISESHSKSGLYQTN